MMEPAIEDIFKFKDKAFVCIERKGVCRLQGMLCKRVLLF